MKKSLGPKTLVYPAPVLVVGTYDGERSPNMMTAAWGGICCSAPPCIAVSLREATYTYGNLMLKQAFTVNIPSQKYVKEADYMGMVSGRDEDKCGAVSLTVVNSDVVDAPYIKEFPVILECQLIQTVRIGGHTQFIGEIKDVKVEESCLDPAGVPDVEKVAPFMFSPGDRRYYAVRQCLGKAFAIGREK